MLSSLASSQHKDYRVRKCIYIRSLDLSLFPLQHSWILADRSCSLSVCSVYVRYVKIFVGARFWVSEGLHHWTSEVYLEMFIFAFCVSILSLAIDS